MSYRQIFELRRDLEDVAVLMFRQRNDEALSILDDVIAQLGGMLSATKYAISLEDLG